jgi:hypothetical protein
MAYERDVKFDFHAGRPSRPRVLPSVLLPLMERQRRSVRPWRPYVIQK